MLLAPVFASGDPEPVDLEYRYVNRSAARILERQETEILGRRMGELYPGVHESGVLRRYLDVFNRSAVESFDLHYTRDGLNTWFHITATRSNDHLALTFADVTLAKRVEAEAEEQRTLNETLVRTGEALSGGLELETIVQRLTDEATRICRAQFGSFFYTTKNEGGDAFLLYTLSGAPKEAFAGFPLPRATPIFGVTFRGEGVLRLDDVRKDPRFGAWGPQPKGHLPVVSYLAIPVTSRGGEVLGGLFFGHDRPGVFTERDERILVAVAAQAAVAIDNARLYQEARRARDVEARRARHAAMQGEIGRALAAGGELRPMLQMVACAIVDKLDGVFARIWTLESGSDMLVLEASAGRYTHLDGAHARVRIGELKIGRIAERRSAHLTNDVRHDPQIGDQAWAEREGIVAFAGYPLVVADRLVGVVATFAAQPFPDDTLEALRAVADTIALSIERYRAEEERERYRALAQAERDHLARVFLRAPVAVAVLRGPQHVYELTNAPYRELIGNRPVEGSAIRDAFPELAGQGRYELLDTVYRTAERYVGKEEAVRRGSPNNAREAFVNFVFEPMLGPNGSAEGIMVVAVDVTDHVVARKRAEALAESLRSSEERFRSLVTATSQIVWTAEVDGARTEDSPTWRAFTGRSFEQWTGWAWLDAVHPDDRERVGSAWRDAVEGKSPYETGYRLLRKDGVFVAVVARAVPIRALDGSVREWIGAITDVTEQRAAEKRLELLARSGEALAGSLDYDETLRALTRLLVPSFADWCWVDVVEEGGVVRRIGMTHADPSDAALALELGKYQPDLRRAHPASDVLASGRTTLLPTIEDAALRQFAQSPEHLDAIRAMRVRSALMVPLSTHGSLKGILTLLATEGSAHVYGDAEVRFAEELGRRASIALDNAYLFGAAQSERTRAEHANRAKDEFLAMMSHELRTPLNAMLGWVRMLRGGTLTEEKTARALETIERNARAQAQLIDDVLDVSRIITGKLRLNVVPVSLLQVVETSIETVRPAADAKGVQLQALLDPDAGTILGDPDRFQQVCWNLLANAVKFTPKGGRVHVRLQREDSYVEVVVEDTGKGIAPEFLPYVFERFRQADASITRVHGGLGLGLAIVKHLVELHGGTIEVHSEGEGKGARFMVRVPIAPLHDVSRAPAVAARPVELGTSSECPPGIAGLRILVLDDEEDARDLLETALTQCKAEVDTAASVPEAMALVESGRYDVIVSDIGMPTHDGYSFIAGVRALPAEKGGRTPAVALTAYARTEDRMRALLAGFQSHVAKPVEPAELLVVIANVAARVSKG